MSRKTIISIIALSVLILGVALLYFLVQKKEEGYNLNIHFFNVGKADAILIEKDNQYMMIDTGEKENKEEIVNYLKEHKKALYDQMLMNGTLSSHLESVQEEAKRQVEHIIEKLKPSSELTEEMKNLDPLKWTGIMNAIKNQAEEIIVNNLINI